MMLIFIIIFAIILYIVYSDRDSNCECDEYEAIRCYNCGHIIEENYNYCPNCKEKLKKQCEGCKRLIGVNWRYCPYCNHPNLDRKVKE